MGATVCPLFDPITIDVNSYKDLVVSFVSILKQVAEHGHTIGAHTWSHANLNNKKLTDDQRKEEILTPKVIIPRSIAETCTLTIGSHFVRDKEGKEVQSIVFIGSNNQQFYYWFINRFNAEFIETNDLWLGHYPIRSTIQQIKKVLEKSITMVMEKKGFRDFAWENQLRDLLAHNMDISLDELRLIAYNYRASDEKQIQVARQQPLRSTKLTLKYQDLINNDPLPILGKLILNLAEKLR